MWTRVDISDKATQKLQLTETDIRSVYRDAFLSSRRNTEAVLS